MTIWNKEILDKDRMINQLRNNYEQMEERVNELQRDKNEWRREVDILSNNSSK